MLSEGHEFREFIGALAEHLQLKEDAAVRLLEGLKAASPSLYRCPFPWSFRVPLEEDHCDTSNGNMRLHAEFLIQSGIQLL